MGNSVELFQEIIQWYPAIAYRWDTSDEVLYVTHQIYFPGMNIYIPFHKGNLPIVLVENLEWAIDIIKV